MDLRSIPTCWHAPISPITLWNRYAHAVSGGGDRPLQAASSPRWSCASWPTSTGLDVVIDPAEPLLTRTRPRWARSASEHQGAAWLWTVNPARDTAAWCSGSDLSDRDWRASAKRSGSCCNEPSPTAAGAAAMTTASARALSAQLVVRSVGYRGAPTPAVLTPEHLSQRRRPIRRAPTNTSSVIGAADQDVFTADAQDTVDTL